MRAGDNLTVLFLHDVRILDPRNLVSLDTTLTPNSIPGIEDVPHMETDLYGHVIGPAAVKRSTNGKVDVKLFWKSNTSELPNLYKVASIYYTETLGSYDVECCFSNYNNILDGKWMSLAPTSSLNANHFLNWNLQVKSTVTEEVQWYVSIFQLLLEVCLVFFIKGVNKDYYIVL